MRYENMSDKELNDRLLELVHGEQVNHWTLSDCEKYIYDCGPTGDQFYKIDLHDYCSDWNATMPLFRKHGLTISDHRYCGGKSHVFSGGSLEPNYFKVPVEDESEPLRAIVICLIRVLEAE